MLIQRQKYLDTLTGLRDNGLIKVVTGIRRCGKSTLLEQFQKMLLSDNVSKEQIIFINFEDSNNNEFLLGSELHKYIEKKASDKKKKFYVFLDEIQMVDDLERIINSLRIRKNLDLYVTGSNAYFLSSELATLWTGRHMDIELFPLSFVEIMSINSVENKDELFADYLQFGGFPGLLNLVVTNDHSIKEKYLKIINTDIIEKDIVVRKHLKNTAKITKVSEYLYSSVGSQISSLNMRNVFQNDTKETISHNTVLGYINYLCESFLFYKCSRFDIRGKELLRTNSKYYCVDTGLRNAMLPKGQSGNVGHQLENIVYIELLRRGYSVEVGKTYNSEIDFIAQKNNVKQYIQVVYLLADEKIIDREFSAFGSIGDNFPRIVLSMDKFDMSQDGIKHKNIIDWLLEDN